MTADALVYTEIIDKVQNFVNDTSSSTDALMVEWINDLYFELTSRPHIQWPFLYEIDGTLSMTTANKTALPSDFGEMLAKGCRDATNNRILTFKPYGDINWSDPDKDSTGTTPIHYTFPEEGYLSTYYAPSASFTLNIAYKKKVSALSGSNTTPLIPNQYRMSTLGNGLAYQYFLYKGDADKIKFYLAAYENGIEKMRQALCGPKADEDYGMAMRDGVDGRPTYE